MLRRFIELEFKAFRRAGSFRSNLVIKILSILAILYFSAVFLFLGVAVYYGLEETNIDPFPAVNRFLILYLTVDLVVRYFFQKLPVVNIKPLLYLNIQKDHIVLYALGKSVISFFNWMHLFLLLPFTIVLLIEGFSPVGAIAWFLGIVAILLSGNFLNILINNNRRLFYSVLLLILVFSGLYYYGIFDITRFTQPVFEAFYEAPFWVLLTFVLLFVIARAAFIFYRKRLYLDMGLSLKQEEAKTEDFSWLNRFGSVGTFIKNDIRMIKRNKRSRNTVMMSLFFLFYGLFFFTGMTDMYEAPVWKIFAGIFISGGFLFTFGQFVPSWDSSYYPLMMTQNIPYRQYLNAKWWLMNLVTLLSALVGTLYLFFGLEAFLAVVVGAIYNMGVNAHLVLLSGAYNKSPIDLTQNKNVMGEKGAFNMKTILLSIPQLGLPLLLYALGHYLLSPNAGYLLIALVGLSGFVLKSKVFEIIEGLYKTEKYTTLAAYKEK